ETIGAYMDVNQRHADLWLLLPRYGEERKQAKSQRHQEEKRGKGRVNGRLRQPTRYAKFHGCGSGGRISSPGRRPERISTPSGKSPVGVGEPSWTGASITAPPARCSRT